MHFWQLCSQGETDWHFRAASSSTKKSSFKLAPRKGLARAFLRADSNQSASWILEMCIIFATLTWPENPADAISEVLNSKIFLGARPQTPLKACFRTLTFRTLRSTVYVALPVPEQLPYSGYATGCAAYSLNACSCSQKFGYVKSRRERVKI